tara:strand:- start:999 stop:2864 length:1866 start_codon:yes stop_codon:yes gene_type:complete
MVKIMTNHVNSPKFNSTLEERTIDQYLKSLDGGKFYFTKDDVKKIRSKLKSFYVNLRKRDCKFISEVDALYIEALKKRQDYAKKYLKTIKEIDKSIKMRLDPDSRDYAKNEEELNSFQEKHIHLQLANILVTDTDLKEAKAMLNRRYKRIVKQVKEQTSVDRYSQLLQAFAHTLDPHTGYLSKKMFEDFQINMSLSLEGIGATLSSQDGYTVIEQLVPGGAAAKSGQLKSQDKILAVAQGKKGKFEPIYDMNLSDVVRLIRGKRKTLVRLKVLRKEGKKVSKFEVKLVREKINLEEEAAQISYVERKVGKEKKKVGVLTLPSFYADNRIGGRSSAKDVKKLLVEASKKNIDALVLDFTNNGGGDLESAVKIGGMFFRTGNVVSHENMKLMDIDPNVYYNGPLVVLINRLSASASEIVSGALKDYKRAVVVGGDHTFGKGSVQQVMRLSPELGSIKFTVGLFYLPGGKSTQHSGVSSDIVFPSPLNSDDIGEKSLDYSLPPNSIKPFLSKTAYGNNSENTWTTVNDAMIKEIRQKSKERIAKNEDFQKIIQDMKEAEEKDKTISISEILSDKNSEAREKRKKLRSMTKNDRRQEYIKSPEVQEAVNIALDLANQVARTVAKK